MSSHLESLGEKLVLDVCVYVKYDQVIQSGYRSLNFLRSNVYCCEHETMTKNTTSINMYPDFLGYLRYEICKLCFCMVNQVMVSM